MAAAVPGGAGDARAIDAHVDLVEQLGSEAYVHFVKELPPVITPDIQELLEDQGTDASVLGNETKFTARVNPDYAPKEGQDIKLVVDTAKLHFFDRTTGEVIR